jgi:hypothetical protein
MRFFPDSRHELCTAIVAAFEILPPETRGCDVPPVERIAAILKNATTGRVSKFHRTHCAPGNAWRFLRTPRGGCYAAPCAAVFLHRLAWHRGRGSANLHGVYADLFRVSRPDFEMCDTAAAIVAHALGGLELSHSFRWGAILPVSAAAVSAGRTR